MPGPAGALGSVGGIPPVGSPLPEAGGTSNCLPIWSAFLRWWKRGSGSRALTIGAGAVPPAGSVGGIPPVGSPPPEAGGTSNCLPIWSAFLRWWKRGSGSRASICEATASGGRGAALEEASRAAAANVEIAKRMIIDLGGRKRGIGDTNSEGFVNSVGKMCS
jgi:hypothetical protein